jgi:hypothetical protein
MDDFNARIRSRPRIGIGSTELPFPVVPHPIFRKVFFRFGSQIRIRDLGIVRSGFTPVDFAQRTTPSLTQHRRGGTTVLQNVQIVLKYDPHRWMSVTRIFILPRSEIGRRWGL